MEAPYSPRRELFDSAKQSFADYPTTGLTPRTHHTATLLTDGRVLIAGGLDGQGNTLSEIEVWDYRTGQSATLAVSLKTPRSGHRATLLSDGTVLLWGGQDQNGSPLNYGEVIDPNGPSVRLVSKPTASLQNSTTPYLAASIPQSGETGVSIDQLISLRFSEPLNVTSLNASTITLRAPVGNVPVQVVPAEGGMLAFITSQDSLENGTAYILSISGATDNAGDVLPDTTIIFTTIAAPESVTTGTQASSTSTSTASSGSAGVGAAATTPSGLTSQWRQLPVLQADAGVTALAGQVLTLDGSPLPNVLVEIDAQHATTDKTGRFLVQNTGSGHHVMIVDGAPANTKSNTYGLYRVGVDLKAGQTNSLNYTFWMTALDTEHVVHISSPTTSEVVVTNPNVKGLELHIPAGTIIHDARGGVVTEVGITAISTTQPPFPIRKGVQFPVYFTIQPGGATFAGAGGAWTTDTRGRGKGATLHYPNYMKGKPGARYQFWNYDPTQRGWYAYGNGRVSDDAQKIVPEDGTQIFSFDAASATTCSGACADPNFPKPKNPKDGEPVDLQTGLFVYTKTDLVLNDVIPLVLTRTYRQGDYISRDFGIGMNTNYDIFLVGDDSSNLEGFTYQDLVLADGGQIRFTRTSPCTGSNGFCQESGAVYTATSTPGDFYGATLALTGGRWVITKRDGTVYIFPATWLASAARQFALIGMYDRYGNALTFTRDSNSNLIKVTSPNGRWIQFSYDSSNRITQAQDNIGRTTSYTYDPASGGLATATDANGGVTKYTYDASAEMLTITDPSNVVYLQNEYTSTGFIGVATSNSSSRVRAADCCSGTIVNTPVTAPVNMISKQTQADGGTYQFVYFLDSNGNVIQTNVTDPRGYQRTVTFNSDGYMTSDTRAVGKPEQQTVTYNVQAGTGMVLGTTDTLNRTTTYSYDAMGNVTSVTRLAGTSNAVTTALAYTQQFYELSSITDPLGNLTALTYDNSGNMLSVSDPLGDTTAFTYNAAGQPITVTDAQGNQTQFTYNTGDLVSITDSLGRTVSRFVDAAGRVAAVTDPLSHTTQLAYDPLNEITSATDPLGNQTGFTYDGNGNRLTVTDANQHTTSYVYNNMDRPTTRTDPLGNQSKAQYDLSGNLIQATDRKGQITTIQYDGLNRATNVTFNDGSAITYTLDTGNRLTGISDSLGGVISRGYDGLDRLLSETTPQGSVAYTYDADGRRQSMTVSGQTPVSYSFDNASRLTSIVQGASGVSFAYDGDGRRTSLTLPNGVVANYTYDAASQLTGIVYAGGALGAQNLQYTYDLAGRRASVSGSLASTQLPAAVSSAVYNANNQLTQWGATAMTYDANGNTLNDGTNSYTWDARNRLVSADNNGASFSYDPLGRRVAKTVMSTTTNFLYDGANAVQELKRRFNSHGQPADRRH